MKRGVCGRLADSVGSTFSGVIAITNFRAWVCLHTGTEKAVVVCGITDIGIHYALGASAARIDRGSFIGLPNTE
jgi:hypothetical protein